MCTLLQLPRKTLRAECLPVAITMPSRPSLTTTRRSIWSLSGVLTFPRTGSRVLRFSFFPFFYFSIYQRSTPLDFQVAGRSGVDIPEMPKTQKAKCGGRWGVTRLANFFFFTITKVFQTETIHLAKEPRSMPTIISSRCGNLGHSLA